MPAPKNRESNPKYLVVDDEIVKKRQREAFIKPTKLPLESGIFVETYEEAVQTLKSNTNIILCFVDLRIPLNKHDKYDLDDEKFKDWPELAQERLELKNEYGVRLLQEIDKIDTYIFSAYAKENLLKRIAAPYDIVKGCFEKPILPEEIQAEIKPYSQLFSQKNGVAAPKFFDYSSLDQETSSFVRSRTIEIKKLARRATEDIINIGNYIIEVKDKLEYGNFYKWLEAEFSWSSRTAARFMSVAQRFTLDSLSELDILPSALYQLAPPSVPDEAVAEAFARAKQGETIAEKTAKEIKAKYKTSNQPTKEKVQPENAEQSDSNQTENRQIILPTLSNAQPPSLLPEKKHETKQQIVAIYPAQKAVKNTWWQLGEYHQLFCGEPTNKEFKKHLPEDIALTISFLPQQDLSLIPSIKAVSSLNFYSEYKDLDLDWLCYLVKNYMETSTQSQEIVVFNYLYYIELLELTEGLNCYCFVAEPDLAKCEGILTRWRDKGTVMRRKF